MDDNRFDSLTRMFGRGASRRSILKGLLGLGGAAVTGAVVEEAAEARTFSLTRIPPPPPPTCSSGLQLCGGTTSAFCCPYGRCFDGLCCPDTSTSRCGSICCLTGDCTSNGTCCTDSDETPCGKICCPTGTCTRDGITDVCCEAPNVVCGLDCCENTNQCCDGECCPAGAVCLARLTTESSVVEEETCCLEERICTSAAGLECCGGDEPCCAIDGCCSGVCYGGTSGRDFCCEAGDSICTSAGVTTCCSGTTPKCCAVIAAAPPVCRGADQCCESSECGDFGDPRNCLAGVCDDDFFCSAFNKCDLDDRTCCPGGSADTAGICCNAGLTCCNAGTFGNICVDLAGSGCCADADCDSPPPNSGSCASGRCLDNHCFYVECEDGEVCCDGNCQTCCAGTGTGCEEFENSICCFGEYCRTAGNICCRIDDDCPTGSVCCGGTCDVGECCTGIADDGRCDPDICCPSAAGNLCVAGTSCPEPPGCPSERLCPDILNPPLETCCLEGQVCCAGICLYGECCTNDDCAGAGELCCNTHCVVARVCPGSCTTDDECAESNICTGSGTYLEYTCVNGTCVSSNEVSCSDGNQCTFDLCDNATGCSNPNRPLGSDCDTCGSNCTCNNGQCVTASCNTGGTACSGPTPNCCSGNCVCGSCLSADACITDGGCCGQDADCCDDGNICTTPSCDGGVCVHTFDCNNAPISCCPGLGCRASGECCSLAGAPCLDFTECCSGACVPDPIGGLSTCQ